MQEEEKNHLLEIVQQHVAVIRQKITDMIVRREKQADRMAEAKSGLTPGDVLATRQLMAANQEQIENLHQLYPSPYFSKCVFRCEGKEQALYFGKFSFSDSGIYSWVTPAATLRFENPGPASYRRPDGSIREGVIESIEHYTIVDGRVVFYDRESSTAARELVYQEHFSQHKNSFMLPEVVEQMEKAQDSVIRASYRGPLVISGAAGSGKTTLALHRIAYLLQSPETASFFTPESVFVLLQDTGTKTYFSKLLPELGIRNVVTGTFAEWAMNILKIENHTYREPGATAESYFYEYNKIQALRAEWSSLGHSKNFFTVLEKIYTPYLTKKQKQLLGIQKEECSLDRVDLTVLLQIQQKEKGRLSLEREYYEEAKNGAYRKKKGSFAAEYNLMVIDEFQNYLPEQLELLKSCLNSRLKAITYVGDVVQQTKLGSVQNWQDIGEIVPSERMVKLQKVYRNTKQILAYIQKLGYDVNVPSNVRSGPPVIEKEIATKNEEIAYVRNRCKMLTGKTVGILAFEADYLEDYKKSFTALPAIHCFNLHEAQGVEFDVVFLVGLNFYDYDKNMLPEQLQTEMKKIQKDLVYVGLTRAMTELIVIGRVSLRKALRALA